MLMGYIDLKPQTFSIAWSGKFQSFVIGVCSTSVTVVGSGKLIVKQTVNFGGSTLNYVTIPHVDAIATVPVVSFSLNAAQRWNKSHFVAIFS